MNAKRVAAAAGVICASQKTKQTAAGIAADLEAACLLQSPESAAELVALRAEMTAAVEWIDQYTPQPTTVPGAVVRVLAGLDAECKRREAERTELWERIERLRARVAELEAFTPAVIQTCRTCGAGYTYGHPCSVCQFKARMAGEQVEDPHKSPLHHDYALGRDLPEVTP